jgi:hypothetical protein
MGVKARRIKVGCGHFADELRQSRVFWPVVLPGRLEVTVCSVQHNVDARDNTHADHAEEMIRPFPDARRRAIMRH